MTYRVVGPYGALGRGLTLENAKALASASGCVVAKETPSGERLVRRVPDRQPFAYELVVDGEASAWFRYDDGWRILLSGPGSTVDRENLLTPFTSFWLESELGLERGELAIMLEAARGADW